MLDSLPRPLPTSQITGVAPFVVQTASPGLSAQRGTTMALAIAPSPTRRTSPADRMRRYERAIKENNDPKSMVDLASMMIDPESGVKPDKARAIQLFERAIKQAGSIDAMAGLGSYLYNEGTRAERRRGISLLERASTLVDHAGVLHALALALICPRCSVKRQPVRAAQLLRKALRHGEDKHIMWLLGLVLVQEEDVPPDTEYAIKLFKRVIEITNDADRLYYLGHIFSFGGAHLVADKRRAVKWYTRAIQSGNHIEAKVQMASTIIYNPESITPDPVYAKSLVSEVLATVTHKEATIILIDLLYGWKETRDFAFAVSLCDFAVRKFNCTLSMYRLGIMLSTNIPTVPVNFPYALSLFERYDQIRDNSKPVLRRIEILLYGAPGVPENRGLARDLLKTYLSSSDDRSLLAALLRVGVQDVIEVDRKRGFEILQTYGGAKNFFTAIWHAIFISENSSCESGIKIDYKEAARLLLSRYELQDRFVVVWTPLCLRLCTISLPIGGNLSKLTLCVKRYEQMHYLSGLNLAGLLLEGHQTSPNERGLGFSVLTELLDTTVGDLAAINLGYLQWHGLCGLDQNERDAVRLYEYAFRRRPGAIAGALLAGSLLHETDGMEADIERAVKLWRWVRSACRRDGAAVDEFERVCSVMSDDVVTQLEETNNRFEAEGNVVAELDVEEMQSRAHLGVDDVKEILRLHSEDDA